MVITDFEIFRRKEKFMARIGLSNSWKYLKGCAGALSKVYIGLVLDGIKRIYLGFKW